MCTSVPLVPAFVRAGAATKYERRNRDTSRGVVRRKPMPWSNQGGGPWGTGGGAGGGGGKGPWGSGPQQSGPTPPDLEEFLRRSQDKLRTVLPGGNLGGKGIGLSLLAAIAIWGLSGFFQVAPDELGVVMRFGKYVRDAKPGLNYHLPYPVEAVLTPKVTRVNRIDIGMRLVEDLRRGTTIRDVQILDQTHAD